MSGQAGLIIRGSIALAVLWAIVWGVMAIAGVFEVTPEKVAVYIAREPLGEIRDAQRRRERLESIAGMINQLDFAERQEFRERRGADAFFDGLSREEKLYLADETMGEAFRQMMLAFNDMDPEERREFVEAARRDLEESERGRRDMERLEKEDRAVLDKITEEGLRAYYRDASAETKLDLAPLMEEMQEAMRRGPRRMR